ncbi:MAG: hypothetical protein KatS3mg015_0557 [Fimbriimonadales bacterium]|nr:MAG: hypothetical protein KatS3mg015_0557 [Fimbriimonadales bacterium]
MKTKRSLLRLSLCAGAALALSGIQFGCGGGGGGGSLSTLIAFASNRDGNFEIYVMNADGTSQTN